MTWIRSILRLLWCLLRKRLWRCMLTFVWRCLRPVILVYLFVIGRCGVELMCRKKMRFRLLGSRMGRIAKRLSEGVKRVVRFNFPSVDVHEYAEIKSMCGLGLHLISSCSESQWKCLFSLFGSRLTVLDDVVFVNRRIICSGDGGGWVESEMREINSPSHETSVVDRTFQGELAFYV